MNFKAGTAKNIASIEKADCQSFAKEENSRK